MGKYVSSKNKLPTVEYDTGGLYGSGKSGGVNSFNPTSFQQNLVDTVGNAVPDYLQQMINPSYDSEIFKARTATRNNLANQSFENNVINPLTERGLTRGSSINQMSGEFANNLANLENQAMAEEDERVNNIVNQLMSYYQIPYNMMTGLQSNNQNLVSMASQQNQADASNKLQMYKAMLNAGMDAASAYATGGASLAAKK